ncbi:MAG: sulfurtransferase TusA [Gammaproteobacteria bacterium]|uniref:sulfurtransferase TusA n=1 Tax=Pseudomaricurvus alcaniphilus TaxID=1166482 RepID=UPI00140AD90E|nr:sulfurtransferase TusA [Pseudomaricurvus alcaniphilus]MBR9912502.1 sulfurtransferase TusA [Gammaproteobacteria bacterium]NHN36283.1 sulfurtransferase TusA [Pseudomaricurvus alcaniphilus]
MQSTFDKILDTSGLRCPEPVMLLHNEIRRSKAGATIKVIATDPSTERDIPRFCQFLGHELLSMSQQEGLYCYLIRKA